MGFLTKSKSFKGGVHPDDRKAYTENLPFEIMPAPSEVTIPLSQHIGKPSKVLVKKRDEVKAGQVIAEPDGFISSIIHSPISGKVRDISRHVHSGGKPKEAITIKAEADDDIERMPVLDPETISPDEIRDRVKQAGVVGQGGAAFPTYVKLTPPEGKNIDCVIVNGAECEPYLTRDYRFMIEQTDRIVGGLKLVLKALGVKRGIIGVEDNKPKAIEMLEKAVANQPNLEIIALRTKYPQGAEKLLIKAALDREVPPGKLPLDVGAVIQNVGTIVAIYDAIVDGMPEITAAMTVSGLGVKDPKNLIVRVGTTIEEVIEYCGGATDDASQVIVGGPMMGVAQYDLTVPVMKATSGILVLSESEVASTQVQNCLKCGKCVDVCALGLEPTNLARYVQLGKWELAEAAGITVCMECGTCAYNCPSNIQLVQWLRLGKQKVIKLQKTRKN